MIEIAEISPSPEQKKRGSIHQHVSSELFLSDEKTFSVSYLCPSSGADRISNLDSSNDVDTHRISLGPQTGLKANIFGRPTTLITPMAEKAKSKASKNGWMSASISKDGEFN